MRVEDAPPREIRFTLALPDSARYSDVFGRSIAISPDGSALVYPGGNPGRPQLFIRHFNEQRPSPIPGTEGAYLPFFSPDGVWLGFVANQRLMKVRLEGGTPVEVVRLLGNTASGATWGPDDVIVLEDVSGLSRLRASGGRLQQVVAIDSLNLLMHWPWFLPRGNAVLCTVTRADGDHIGVVTLPDGRLTVFDEIRGTDARFVAPGYIMWASNDGVLLAAPFDDRVLRPTGPPVAVRQGIVVDGGGAKVGIGPEIVVTVEGGAQRARLLRLDRKGASRAERPEELEYMMPRFSPDGRRLAVIVGTGAAGGELWVMDRVRGTRQRLALDFGANWVEWSPDGKRLVFGYIAAPSWEIYAAPADGSGKPEPLVTGPQTEFPVGWSLSGKFAFWRATQKRGDIVYVDSIGGAVHDFAATDAEEAGAILSPNGRWLAYVSDHSGQREVYVRPFPSGDGRWQISADGGIEPRWSRNGREIIYRDGDLFLAVPIVPGPGISTGTVDTLFRRPYATNTRRAMYDVTRDGQELMIVGAESGERTLSVTINPFPELFGRGRRSP